MREQRGFGLIELLMALVMLNVGLLAVVAAFTSGIWGIARAGQISTASSLGDAQMELYRGLPNYFSTVTPFNLISCIYLVSPPSSGTYATDSAYSASQVLDTSGSPTNATSCASAAGLNGSPPSKATNGDPAAVVGPDHHLYDVDTYMVYYTPAGGEQTTQVTVVVRDGVTPSKVLSRQSSVFDPNTP